jgi:hypothetical protein
MLPAGMHMLPIMQTLPEPQHWMPQRLAPKPQHTMSSMHRSLGAQMLRPHSTLPLAAMNTPAVQQQQQSVSVLVQLLSLYLVCSCIVGRLLMTGTRQPA